MKIEIEKLYAQARQQHDLAKRGYVARDYGRPGTAWKCEITFPVECQEGRSGFLTQEEAIEWGCGRGVETPGFLIIFSH